IAKLSEDFKLIETQQKSIEYDLDFINQQQNELDQIISVLEKDFVKDDDFKSSTNQADHQREQMLRLQAQLDAQLKQMEQDMSQVSKRVRTASQQHIGLNQTLHIAEIMYKQLGMLQWIDKQTKEIKKKVDNLNSCKAITESPSTIRKI
ncbi:hypothetical protein D917_02768, partial [Trichinella nativa]